MAQVPRFWEKKRQWEERGPRRSLEMAHSEGRGCVITGKWLTLSRKPFSECRVTPCVYRPGLFKILELLV